MKVLPLRWQNNGEGDAVKWLLIIIIYGYHTPPTTIMHNFKTEEECNIVESFYKKSLEIEPSMHIQSICLEVTK